MDRRPRRRPARQVRGQRVKVLFPTSFADACAMMGAQPEAVPIAGGTDLLVHWPARAGAHERTYVDLSKLSGLRRMTHEEEGLRLGALTTYWDVITDARAVREFPLLIEAARQVGAVQIQSRGTWAGNIANGSPAADGVPALMALDARVELACATGTRSVRLSEYYTGYRASVKRPDELIASVFVPRRELDFSFFFKVGPRRAQAITKVGLVMTRESAGGKGAGTGTNPWRVVANSVAPTVRRCPAIEAMLHSGTPITSPDGFLSTAKRDIAPIDDIRSTSDYRMTVFCRLLYHALKGRTAGVS